MSRIIVKNLPDKITKDKLLEMFGQKHIVTDIQLKFTKTGKFRKFAFVGFKSSESAEAAKLAFNNSYIGTSQIQIEICSELGDPKKTRPWSKYAPENIVLGKRLQTSMSNKQNRREKSKESEKEKIRNVAVLELIKNHENDIGFSEFIELNAPENKIGRHIIEEKKNGNDKKQCDNNLQTLATQTISDSEYIKLKTGTDINFSKNTSLMVQKKANNMDLFTIKLCGFPLKIKKSQIKKFLSPLKPFTIRKALKIRGVVYCGFKTEKEMKGSLLKNRSFFGEKQIFITAVKNKVSNDLKLKEKWKKEIREMENLETIAESGRIFFRNLSYTATEDDLKAVFEKFGPLTDLVLPVDPFTRKPKGFGLVTFLVPENAWKAFNQLDGTIFQGRMLHLMPARPNDIPNDTHECLGDTFKKKKLKKDKDKCEMNWNTFFIGENALAETVAATYDTTKETVLDDEQGKAAVRLALGETQFVSKMKEFLKENDVSLHAFENMAARSRSKTVILVKNLPFGTKSEEIHEKFSKFGMLKRIVLPPGGVAALVEFVEPSEAKVAFRKISYSKFKHVPMYLEWAPEKIFVHNEKSGEKTLGTEASKEKDKKGKEHQDSIDLEKEQKETGLRDGCIIFVKNLNFLTEEKDLKQHFSSCGEVVSATIARKKIGVQPGKNLSLGYGFVQFSKKEHADKALKLLQFSEIHNHKIELKQSNRTTGLEVSRVRNSKTNDLPGTKILVRNVPFQASQGEIFDLFRVFGEIKAVRLPKKMTGGGLHRGFGFVEFDTLHDAKRAFEALSQSTHLYGRRLVLEWAAADDDVVSLRRKTAHQFKSDVAEKKKKFDIEEDSDKEE